MPGFTANASAPVAAPATGEIAGDGWYPALKVATFLEAVRIGTAVTPARAREALLAGIVSAQVALDAWRDEQEAAGADKLDDVTIRGRAGRKVGGELLAVVLFRRAVHSAAAADLVETHHDVTATEAGRDRRETRAASADEFRRDATHALRDLMSRGRAKVALV